MQRPKRCIQRATFTDDSFCSCFLRFPPFPLSPPVFFSLFPSPPRFSGSNVFRPRAVFHPGTRTAVRALVLSRPAVVFSRSHALCRYNGENSRFSLFPTDAARNGQRNRRLSLSVVFTRGSRESRPCSSSYLAVHPSANVITRSVFRSVGSVDVGERARDGWPSRRKTR